ncbi:hypothetical protein GCE86_09710 [Micromonospora terminaliae]|uniref:Uncharacterized protein n=1 Tax=Micromonospora terminaliae TaxID=1914461 RepID=A0ABX6DZM7_9ACTN|nr:hypothetical protein GCE86_09710 [Micromonospora terminaliae]
MDSYPAVEAHGLIGDLQTAALVAMDGTLDWFSGPVTAPSRRHLGEQELAVRAWRSVPPGFPT